jgi:hypothetical protein
LESRRNIYIEKKKNKPNFKESVAGVAASQIIPMSSIGIGIPVINKMSKIATNLTQAEIDSLNKASETILNTTGLKKLGVEIVNIDKVQNLTGLPDKIAEIMNPIIGTAKGKNAFFTDKEIFGIIGGNKIGINKQKLPTAAFHEIGHAINYNKSGFWKTMQKLRTPGILIATTLGIFAAVTKKSKPKEGEELSKDKQIKEKIRNNSGKLAFLAMTPMLAEEAMASIRGCKEAKKILDPSLYKKVAKTNKVAYISYISTALGVGLAAFGARKIKDKLVEIKEAKLEKKNRKAMHA